MSLFIEACCPDLESVRRAVKKGVNRIELCEHLSTGGLTPSEPLIEAALAVAGDIPVNVLIRPRGGGFTYAPEEVRQMCRSIDRCKCIGVNGVVIGALDRASKVDIPAMSSLLSHADGLQLTFHRAFDLSDDPFDALEAIIGLGMDRLLTSGHAADAWSGRMILQELVNKARGRIVIMPGCGVTPDNLQALARITGAREFHGSKLY